MPKVFIDGKEHMAAGSRASGTVGELLAELGTELAGSRRMIQEVGLDGVSLTEASLPEASQRQAATVGTIILKTMTYQELARFGLDRADLLLPEVIRDAAQCAESFRFRPPEEANRSYATCLEDLQLFVDMVEQALKLTDPHSRAAPPSLQQLAAVTGQLLSAHRRDDVMMLADLLSYELVPLLQDMQGVLRELRERVSSPEDRASRLPSL